MRPFKYLKTKLKARAYRKLTRQARRLFPAITPLDSRGDRPLQMSFEDQFDALIYFHLQEHDSGRHLLQALEENDFAREYIAPEKGIKKSAFFEAINNRGLEQLCQVFTGLTAQAKKILPRHHDHLGELVAIDGSLIDAVLSMYWADYRGGSKKAKAHVGFNINQGIPSKLFLTDGKGDERPFVDKILVKGQTGVMDRYYQCHKNFDQWQTDGKHFVCRIKENTTKTIIRENTIPQDSIVFYDAVVLLGTKGVNRTEKELRVVGYRVDGTDYWVATSRFDLTAEEVAEVYKLRWSIESFFGWWKQHLKVYHLIARTKYGLMVQLMAGLITYLLLAMHCHEEHGETVSIKRVRELRFAIENEAAQLNQQATSKKHRRRFGRFASARN